MQVTRFMLKCRLYVSMSAIWRRNMWFAIRKYSHAAKERSDVFISFTYINILFDVGGVVAFFSYFFLSSRRFPRYSIKNYPLV